MVSSWLGSLGSWLLVSWLVAWYFRWVVGWFDG